MNGTLTIPEKMVHAIHRYYSPGTLLTCKEIIDTVCTKYPGTNRDSVIPSDYCDNKKNKASFSGIIHIFHYVKRNTYQVLKRPA